MRSWRVPLVLLGAAAAAAFSPVNRPHLGTHSRPRTRLIQAKDDSDDNSDIFAAFAAAAKKNKAEAKKNKPLKKGEGAPSKGDVEGLPIRMGGTKRDGSLGDLRAAANTLKTLSNPRDWQAEEYGFISVILAFVLGTAFFYNTYVADAPIAKEFVASKATVALTKAIAECDSQECITRVQAEKEPAIVLENQLEGCMDRAFSGTERNICKSKFGGAMTPFGF